MSINPNTQAEGGLAMPLAAGNERPPVAGKYNSICMSRPTFFKNDTAFPFVTSRINSVNDVQSSMIRSKCKRLIVMIKGNIYIP